MGVGMNLQCLSFFACFGDAELNSVTRTVLNPLAPELFFFLISAHPVYKM